MPTLNFPTSPSLNDTYSFGTKTWIWNGAAWQLNSSGAINNIPIGNVTPSTGAFTTLSASGNITGSYIIGNGSQLTGLPAGYANSDAANYFASGTVTSNVITSGNITGSYFIGNGSTLTNITGANVTGTVANATYATSAGSATSATSATTAGTVTTAAQPNITSVGTLSSVTVTANVTGGNINTAGLVTAGNITTNGPTGTVTAGFINATGNLSGGNITTSGFVSATGNILAGNILTNGLIDAFGNITTGGNIFGASSIGTNGNIFGGTAINTPGLISANGNIIGGNVSTAGLITATGNITGGNLRTAGAVSATGSVIGGSISTTGNVTGGNLIISGGIFDASQLTIQTTAANANIVLTPNGTGNVNIGRMSASGNITGSYFIGNGSQLTGLPASGLTWTTVANTAPTGAKPGDFWYNSFSGIKYQYINDGTSNVWVDQSYPTTFSSLAVAGNGTIGGTLAVSGNVSAPLFVGTATQARYADLAENYSADAEYAPGTVLIFGGTHEVTVSAVSHDTRVAGVVSTAPAYLMNSAQPGAAVALTGKVPCQVQGPVDKGDLLVNIGPGLAGRLDPAQYRPGCVVGKSLESIPDTGTRTIEIAVGRF